MPTRKNTWTERRPYPPEPREKYGATTPSLGAHEEHTDLVEASHVAAHSEREIRARQAAPAPPHAVGYGGIGELDDRAFQEAEWAYGVDPGTPASTPIPALETEGSAEDEDRGGASETAPRQGHTEGADDEDDEYEAERASHAPEGSGMRSTFPSLDHVSTPP
jgi:hypothetical protein